MNYRKWIFTGFTLLQIMQSGCGDDFLDQKPDLFMAVPTTLADCQAMLDDYSRMNAGYPDHGEAAADNYYFTDAVYNTLFSLAETPEEKHNYLWNPVGEHVEQWGSCYKVIYSANMILSVVDKFSSTDANFKQIRGSALFFRAFSLFNLAQLFCKPYTATTAGTDLGIPLRMTPDPNEKSSRGTVRQTYEQIIRDLTESIALLPADVSIKSRPSKAAAYGALARTCLAMGDYDSAGIMANEALKLYNTLIDYNLTSSPATATTVGSGAGASFVRFHAEVIFQATSVFTSLSTDQMVVDPDLYDSYSSNDRRKSVFFTSTFDPNTGDLIYTFRGNYEGNEYNSNLFTGIATDELYLMRAECYARSGQTNMAMVDLNALMTKRMKPPYTEMTASSADDALRKILRERRKELLFRGLRWMDLRRLNQDPRFAVTLHRNHNNLQYTPLLPNDLRYTMLIPTKQVINLTDMEQNER